MTDENKKKKHHRRHRKIHRFNLGEPIPPIHHWLDYTPVIPKLYWDVYSQEERWKKLCIEYDRLCAYANFLAKNINSLIDEIEKILEEIETIKTELENCKTRLTALENWQTTINTWKKTVDDHLSDIDSDIANIKVDITNIKTRITNLESSVNNLTSRMSKAESNITTAQTKINSLEQRTTTAEGNIAELQTESETAQKDITDLKNKFPVSLDNISDDAKIDTVTAQSKKLVTSGAVYEAIKDITGFTKQKNCLVIGTFGPRTDLYPTNLINFTEIVDSGYSLTAIKEEALTQISLGVADYDYIVLTGGVSNYFDDSSTTKLANELATKLLSFSEITTVLHNSTELAKPKVFYINDIQCDTAKVGSSYRAITLSTAYKEIDKLQHNAHSSAGTPYDTYINYSNFNLWPNKHDTYGQFFDTSNEPTALCERNNSIGILGAIGYIQPPQTVIHDTFDVNSNTVFSITYTNEGDFINARCLTNGGDYPLLCISTDNYTINYLTSPSTVMIANIKTTATGWFFGDTNANFDLFRILQRTCGTHTAGEGNSNYIRIRCDVCNSKGYMILDENQIVTMSFNLDRQTTFASTNNLITIHNLTDQSTDIYLRIKEIFF